MKALCVAIALALGGCLPASAAGQFTIEGAQFKLDGAPFQIRSGELHYPRIPRELWRERLRMARAMGLNTVTTYAFWSQHEAEPGQWDFSGQRDLRAFVQTAASEGLKVILRPGPYVCAEVDFGGFPAWLLRTPGLRVRSMDPRYMAASARYLKRLAQEVGDLQSTRGGPILMLQLENEYGSYGRDHDYLRAMLQQMRDAGFDAPLFTSDGGLARLFAGGTLKEVPAVVNFGGGLADARESFQALQAWRPRGPRMAGEYWAGWFDHWGEARHTQPVDEAAATVGWMMAEGVSFNLYTFHGGTSFGWLPGANYSAAEPYQPDTTSYDYDAALDESGRVTPKYLALLAAIAKHLPPGQVLPAVPTQAPAISIPAFGLSRSVALLDALPALGSAIASRFPLNMEAYGQNYGYILYRKHLSAAAKGKLSIHEARDHALVLADGRPIATLDRRKGDKQFAVDLPAGTQLDILVENMGRIGFGAKLDGEIKGITQSVQLNDEELLDWQVQPLPLQDLGRLPLRSSAPHQGPGFWQGEFDLAQPGDSFLDTRGWGKGQVWVNGHHLGRFWNIGPQQTLYLPGVWLKPGRNEVLVFSLEAPAAPATLRGLDRPLFDTPAAAP